MKHTISFIFLLAFTHFSFAQIELNINKLDNDSFEIHFTEKPYLEMNKVYKFIVKTNIEKEDSLFINLDPQKAFIENNMMFEHSFNHHNSGIIISKRTSPKSRKAVAEKTIIDIKGAKYILNIDGEQYFRQIGGSVKPKSHISIEFISDIYNLEDIEIKDPIIFTWNRRMKVKEKYYLESYKFTTKLNKLKKHKKAYSKDLKCNFVVIIFPQAYLNGNPIFPEDKRERMAMLRYDK